MAAFQVTRDAVPPDLVAAWQRVREHWGVPRYHDELLQLTAQLERYAWVAAKYREVGRMRNADPVADAELARLRRAAEVTLAVSASVRPERAPRSYGALSAMLLLVMLLAIASFAYARLRPLPAPPVPPLGHGDVEVLGP